MSARQTDTKWLAISRYWMLKILGRQYDQKYRIRNKLLIFISSCFIILVVVQYLCTTNFADFVPNFTSLAILKSGNGFPSASDLDGFGGRNRIHLFHRIFCHYLLRSTRLRCGQLDFSHLSLRQCRLINLHLYKRHLDIRDSDIEYDWSIWISLVRISIVSEPFCPVSITLRVINIFLEL